MLNSCLGVANMFNIHGFGMDYGPKFWQLYWRLCVTLILVFVCHHHEHDYICDGFGAQIRIEC